MRRKASNGHDPGVQPERTALAWQRTALATAAGSAIVARHTVGPLGPGALVVLAVSLGLALAAFVLGRRRYLAGPTGSRLTAADPRRPWALPRRDGVAPALLSLAVLTLALTELSAALLHS